MELREIIEPKIQILSEKKNKDGSESMMILAPWIVTGRKNKNGRLYPFSLIQREVEKIQSSIKKGSFLGTGDHPLSGIANVETASHIPQKVWLDKDGKGWMETKIVPTTRGKNIQTLVKNGASLGLSARGFGEVGRDGVVQTDYKLVGIDIVTSPSEPSAVFNKDNVFESQNFEEQNPDDERQKDLEEAVADLEKESYLGAVEDGYSGTQEEWEELCKGNIRRIMGLKESDGKTVVKKLTEGQISARIHGYFVEACSAGYKGTFAEWKEKFPQIIESASRGKIVIGKVEEPKEVFKSKTNWNEILASGFTGTMKEWKEQFPNIEIMREEVPEKIVAEKALTEKSLKAEAGRIFTGLLKDKPTSQITLEDVEKMLKIEEEKKVDIRIRRKAIAIVSHDVFNAGGNVSDAKLEKMIKIEIERLTEERRLRREKNWECYRRLLD